MVTVLDATNRRINAKSCSQIFEHRAIVFASAASHAMI